jgi:dienelactone hydrolase
MKSGYFGAVAALALLWPAIASAEDVATVAARFGALQSINHISLAPDGQHISFISPVGDNSVLFVADMEHGGAPVPIARVASSEGRLSRCDWSADDRLICTVTVVVNTDAHLLGFNRLLSLDSDGSNIVNLSARTNTRSLGLMQDGGGVIDWDVEGAPGSVLVTREYVPENTMGTYIKHDEQGLGVDQMDTRTQRRRVIEGPRRDAVGYISDGHANVRIMGTQGATDTGFLRSRLRYFYRKQGSRDWEALSTVQVGSGPTMGFEPYAVDSAKNLVYGFDDLNGFQALYSISLDGTATRSMVLARPDVDVDSLLTVGRDNRVVGVSYATERRNNEYFDPELRDLSAALSRALPGHPGVTILDASRDESRLLLMTAGDTNPGMLYLYDKPTRHLEEILPVRGDLTGVRLADVQPVTYPAADGTVIPAYLTLPPGSNGRGLPAIVMPHGGPGARDEWGFDWLAQFYAARGFAVLQPNFRGSAGYGAAWFQKNGFQSWRVAVGDVNDAGRWLEAQGIAAPGKLAIVGWSYGGYAALQSAVLDPDLFKAIVAIAPVTDLERLRQESANYTDYSLVDRFIGSGPHVREGSPAQNADRIKAPVLLFHGTLDQNVGSGESRLMDQQLRAAGKDVRYIEFPGLSHQLESSEARTRMLSESDAFLRHALGLPAG